VLFLIICFRSIIAIGVIQSRGELSTCCFIPTVFAYMMYTSCNIVNQILIAAFTVTNSAKRSASKN